MASYRFTFRAFLLSFLSVFVIFVICGFQILYKTSLEYDDADDYIFEEEDETYNKDINIQMEQQHHNENDGAQYVVKEEDERSKEDINIQMEQSHLEKDGAWHAVKELKEEEQHEESEEAVGESIHDPIIMWWYGFTHEKGRTKKCGNVSCFLTNDRHYFYHPMMKVFIMYGTSLDIHDLPFPRLPHHEWALMHEESPKNVYLYSHHEIMELFNLTATFKRESHYPLTTLWLDDIENIETSKYLLPVKEKTRHQEESGLAMVAYIHSDCGCPSDRDHFVEIIQKHIKVDSYGRCKHNKDLPANLTDALRSMDKPEFYRILAKYKFIITAENGVCDDYITEKFWRTFEVGSVPIFIGSKKIKDFLPDDHSAIIVDDFTSMKELVDLMNHLNENDDEYNKYLEYKSTGIKNKYLLELMESREWGRRARPHGRSFVSATECFVCKKIHENIEREKNGLMPLPHRATVEHYGCPKPKKFSGIPPNDLERVDNNWHATEWINTFWRAKALKQLWSEGKTNFSDQELNERSTQLRYKTNLQ